MEKFKELGINEELLKIIRDEKYTEPTEIQKETIPMVIAGKDVIARAATGSGKTLAFGAGLIQKAVRGNGVQALIMTPTRELAEQVSQVLRNFSKHFGLHVTEVYGGVGYSPQIAKLKTAEIVVGTPGRILDHLRQGTLNLKGLKTLVLDEADRMLDMGFIKDITTIVDQCPKDRQTLLFSATISPDIQHMSKRYMIAPTFVSVESYVDASKLAQTYYDVPTNQKFSLLVHLLKQERTGLVMVFCNTRRNADFIGRNLKRERINAVIIHGGLSQNRRTNVMELFSSNEATILICTDVAARGLDIKNVSHVYNYDLPTSPNDYIHRIGRTARAGKEGMAVSLVSGRDYENFRNILEDDSLKIKQEDLPEFPPVFVKFHDDGEDEGRGGGGRRFGGGQRGGYRGGGRSGGRDSGRSGGSRFGGSRGGSRGGSSGSRGRSGRGNYSRR